MIYVIFWIAHQKGSFFPNIIIIKTEHIFTHRENSWSKIYNGPDFKALDSTLYLPL